MNSTNLDAVTIQGDLESCVRRIREYGRDPLDVLGALVIEDARSPPAVPGMSIPAGFLLLAMFLPHVGCLRLSVPAGWINYMGRMMRVLFLAHSDDSVAESRLLPELRDVELFDMDKENLFGANEDGTAAAFSKSANDFMRRPTTDHSSM